MMKKLLSVVCLIPYLSYGQWEYGLGVGMSVNSTPSDNVYYQADKYIPNYALQAVILDNFGKDKTWQAGLDIHCVQLANKSSKQFNWDQYPKTPVSPTPLIGNDGTKFVFGQFAVAATAIINKKFPVGAGQMYIGIAVGYAAVRNCRGTGSSVISYMAPDGGTGSVYGGQIGYDFYTTGNTCFNIEFAPRYYSLTFSGADAPYVYPHTDLKFNTIAYPITLGYRYTFPKRSAKTGKESFESSIHVNQIEYGAGGGMSQNGTPDGNVYYLGDQMIANYAFNAFVGNNFGMKGVWQAGLEGHVFELANTSTTSFVGEDRPTVGGDDKKIVYSKLTTTICAVGNRKFMLGRNELYLGVAVGFGIARSNNHLTPDESYVAPDGGRGMVFGGQVGYTLFLTPHFGLNIEAAPRYLCMTYDAMAPYYTKPHNNLYYNVWAYPVTFGFRIKLNKPNGEDIPTFDLDRYQRKRSNWH